MQSNKHLLAPSPCCSPYRPLCHTQSSQNWRGYRGGGGGGGGKLRPLHELWRIKLEGTAEKRREKENGIVTFEIDLSFVYVLEEEQRRVEKTTRKGFFPYLSAFPPAPLHYNVKPTISSRESGKKELTLILASVSFLLMLLLCQRRLSCSSSFYQRTGVTGGEKKTKVTVVDSLSFSFSSFCFPRT